MNELDDGMVGIPSNLDIMVKQIIPAVQPIIGHHINFCGSFNSIWYIVIKFRLMGRMKGPGAT
jgi:hypothetical protein